MHPTPRTLYPVVLQVLPALGSGGVERGTVEMTAAIARAGGAALVASAGGPLTASVEQAGGRNVLLPLTTKNPLRIFANAGRLSQVIGRNHVDIVHARSRAPAWSAWLAARRTGAHFVTTYHGAYGEDLPFKRHYNAVMARGEVVIAGSHYVAGLLAARHGVEAARIRVIPRGVDPALFDPAAISEHRVANLVQRWRLPDGMAIVALPGRLTRWKGQAVLIEALARATRRDLCAVLIGDDQGRHRYSAELASLAERLGVADRVRMVGHCEDMPAALLISDIVVNASTDPEAFGRVVIEAQAMARPVIATDHGGAVETVEQGVTGWRVPPDDARALAGALDDVLAMDAQDRAALGRRARAAVSARYTVRAMQDATMAVYHEVLDRESAG